MYFILFSNSEYDACKTHCNRDRPLSAAERSTLIILHHLNTPQCSNSSPSYWHLLQPCPPIMAHSSALYVHLGFPVTRCSKIPLVPLKLKLTSNRNRKHPALTHECGAPPPPPQPKPWAKPFQLHRQCLRLGPSLGQWWNSMCWHGQHVLSLVCKWRLWKQRCAPSERPRWNGLPLCRLWWMVLRGCQVFPFRGRSHMSCSSSTNFRLQRLQMHSKYCWRCSQLDCHSSWKQTNASWCRRTQQLQWNSVLGSKRSCQVHPFA